MSDLPTDKLYWTLEEVAELLAVNYQLIYRQVRAGELPAVRVGRVYRVKRSDLQNYLDRNSTVGGSGFDCCACGRHYASQLSRRGEDPKTQQPICLDCWDRKKIRACHEGSDPSKTITS